jgi:hypothetical protein
MWGEGGGEGRYRGGWGRDGERWREREEGKKERGRR